MKLKDDVNDREIMDLCHQRNYCKDEAEARKEIEDKLEDEIEKMRVENKRSEQITLNDVMLRCMYHMEDLETREKIANLCASKDMNKLTPCEGDQTLGQKSKWSLNVIGHEEDEIEGLNEDDEKYRRCLLKQIDYYLEGADHIKAWFRWMDPLKVVVVRVLLHAAYDAVRDTENVFLIYAIDEAFEKIVDEYIRPTMERHKKKGKTNDRHKVVIESCNGNF